ncbi:hypothetical protein [Paenibacillus xylanexedens]|uniref:Uncharacterized protein n=1 Tax=Paenibacillus xylanexedens TaxID=528191 RepID=A0ABS4RYA9_PAEXY|nr:hypothetical protein [Paenibacillus xylanexedens]MBP2247335.1 hypothetical protein [Paenibacillus xylanexedens]
MKIIADKSYIVSGRPAFADCNLEADHRQIMMKKDRRSADEAFSRSFMSWIRPCAVREMCIDTG